MRGGVLQLSRWGVLPAIVATGTPAVRQVTFHYGDDELVIPIKARDGVDALYAPRRSLLDRSLADRAMEAGADLRFRVRLLALLRAPEGRVRGAVVQDASGASHRIEADFVIGADGRQSTVAKLAGATPYVTGRHSTAVVYGYFPDVPQDGYHWYWQPGVSAGAIPTNDGLTCIFVSVPTARAAELLRGGFHALLDRAAPMLAARVARAPGRVALRGFPGETGFIRQSWGTGWALVGDAGYFKDPLTAHGITDALRDAELLASAVADGRASALSEYQTTRDELARGLFEVTDEIASFNWDLTSVRVLHETLAHEMSREVKLLLAA
jgi:2-polyprenyl-6-methoxyphenol hydroxylase-like FAD-dependent oxidoreductase